MLHAIRIVFITSTLFLVPAVGSTADSQLATVDANCIGIACGQTPPATNQRRNTYADFSPTSVELLFAGIALIVFRIVAKKYFSAKPQ